MELLFLGTPMGVLTRSCNVTTILLNPQHPIQTGLWLFDCGGGVQHQMLTTPFNPGKLDRIFTSHLHGDHLFGLSGLLYSRSVADSTQSPTLYGPKGLRKLTETTLHLSGFWIDYPLDIVEIIAGEIVGDGLWKVTTYPLAHPLECYGFRIQERDRPGALDTNALEAADVKAGPWFQDLRAGKTIVLEDGQAVNDADFLSSLTRGKSVAIFGDTGSYAPTIELVRGVDVVIHETTLDTSMEEKTNNRGHSLTRQAVQLALGAGAGHLITIHINSCYGEKGC